MRDADAPELATLERWMQAVVMHTHGAEAGVRSAAARRLLPGATLDLRGVVLPSSALTPIERLDIYAHMYYMRLIEILQQEYPTTLQILGRETFVRVCRRFIEKHPSRHRSLNRLSEKFPDFLARALPRGHRRGLAVDVARIERAMEDVFDAERAQPLTAAAFAAIGAEQWGRVRLRVTPALRFLKLRYSANDYMNAVRAKATTRIPRPRARGSFVIVFRRGFQVFRKSQTADQFRLLELLAAGRTLAEAVSGSVARRSGGSDRLAVVLGAWFREWAASGLFCGVSRNAK